MGPGLPARPARRWSPSGTRPASCACRPAAAPPTEVQRLSEVDGGGEGGLLGIAVSPAYARDGLVYVYYTTGEDNRIARMRLGQPPQPIVTGIPRSGIHNGGRLVFGPDGFLYAGTGDAVRARPVPGRRLARRQGAADDAGGPAGAGQPVRRLAGLVQGPPQRAGPRLRLGAPAVGQRVRAEPLRRGEPHRAGQGLRLAAGGGRLRRQPVRRAAGHLVHRRGVTERGGHLRRHALRRGAARRAAVGGAAGGDAGGHARGRCWRASTAGCARWRWLRTARSGC